MTDDSRLETSLTWSKQNVETYSLEELLSFVTMIKAGHRNMPIHEKLLSFVKNWHDQSEP